VAILAANLCLRPSRKMYRWQAESHDAEVPYVLSAVCRDYDEQYIRALLLQMVSGVALMLRALYSEDMENPAKIEVRATLIGPGGSNSNVAMEQIVSRLSLKFSVSAVSWEIPASG
jgi:putative Mg2+ transporter-C (MgtC) family protein